MPEHTTTIRPPSEDEFQSWAPLFRTYRAFYNLGADETVVEQVWSWIRSPVHEMNALIAVTNDGVTVGLAHYRRFARPSTGTMGIYLDDLLSDPAHRGTGIGRSLIEAVTQIGVRQGSSILRWITAADNATAQQLHDRIATRTTWLTYDKPCREPIAVRAPVGPRYDQCGMMMA